MNHIRCYAGGIPGGMSVSYVCDTGITPVLYAYIPQHYWSIIGEDTSKRKMA